MPDALPQPPLEAGASKHCSGCNADRPRSAFYSRQCGKLSSKCRECVAAKVRERQFLLRQQRRAERTPWQAVHAARVQREREARRIARQAERAQRDAATCPLCERSLPLDCFGTWRGKPAPHCRPCTAAKARKLYHKGRGRIGQGRARETRASLTPERRREIEERTSHLTARLHGTAGRDRINTEGEWDEVTAELRKLWHLSGDKECVSCHAAVPPERMLPPGPANFYPGHCRGCAAGAYDGHRRDTYGPPIGPLPGSPRLPMRDGTTVTVATFASRVAERQRSYRFSHFPR